MSVIIERMAGFATVQDRGRQGFQAGGVPRSGAMDSLSLALANLVVGNAPEAAAMEWALAGGSLRFQVAATVSLAGAEVVASLNGKPISAGVGLECARGDELRIERFTQGVYLYVAISGGIAVPLVLGSRSTCVSAGFGGLEGRRLRAGDTLALGSPLAPGARFSASPRPGAVPARQAIRVVEGPDTDSFPADFREAFWASEFTVSRDSSRAGYRLARDSVRYVGSGDMLSEPACIGAIQVPSGMGAIVLMADGPTIGGYPKIGVVASVDLPALAQRAPGEAVRFEVIPLVDAQQLLREGSLAVDESRA